MISRKNSDVTSNESESFDILSKIISELENYDKDLTEEPFPRAVFEQFKTSSTCDQFIKGLTRAELCDNDNRSMFISMYEKIDRMRKAKEWGDASECVAPFFRIGGVKDGVGGEPTANGLLPAKVENLLSVHS